MVPDQVHSIPQQRWHGGQPELVRNEHHLTAESPFLCDVVNVVGDSAMPVVQTVSKCSMVVGHDPRLV